MNNYNYLFSMYVYVLIFCYLIFRVSFAYSADDVSEDENYDDFYNSIYEQREIYDPMEKFNRKIYPITLAIDKTIVYPSVSTYRAILPNSLRLGIHNVLNNMMEPRNAINALLQGKRRDFLTSIWRLGFNSTFGLFGIADVATKLNVKSTPHSFKETMYAGGLKTSPYVVVPLFGVYPLFVLTAEIMDSLSNPVLYASFSFKGILYGLIFLHACDSYFDIKRNIIYNSVDSYAKFRNIYEQLAKNKGR